MEDAVFGYVTPCGSCKCSFSCFTAKVVLSSLFFFTVMVEAIFLRSV
jgi:hypothetical protein